MKYRRLHNPYNITITQWWCYPNSLKMGCLLKCWQIEMRERFKQIRGFIGVIDMKLYHIHVDYDRVFVGCAPCRLRCTARRFVLNLKSDPCYAGGEINVLVQTVSLWKWLFLK